MPTLALTASTILARLSSGDLKAATVAEISTLLGIAESEFAVLDRDGTNYSADNTTTETTVYTHSVPANTIGTNKLLHIKMTGRYKQGDAATRTETFRLKFGTTTVAVAHKDVPDTDNYIGYVGNFYLVGDGSTSAQLGWFHVSLEENVNGHTSWIGYGTSSKDSTTALDIEVTFQHDTASTQMVFDTDISHLTLEG